MTKKLNTIVIHIGMHKTGSSSIQETLHNHPANEKYTYLDLGTVNHNRQIFSQFTEHPEQYYLNLNVTPDHMEEFLKEGREQIISAISNCNTDNIIVSGEDLIVLTPQALQKLKTFFSEYFEAFQIVAYVRSPASYMTSLMQQCIKSGIGLQRFIKENPQSCLFPINTDMFYPRYQACFTKFENIFGRDSLMLRDFNPAKLHNGDVVQDFFNIFRIPLEPEKICRSNESISREALAVIYAIRKTSIMSPNAVPIHQVDRISQVLSAAGGGKFLLSSTIIDPIVEKYQNDISWIKARMGDFSSEGTSNKVGIRTELDLLRIEKAVQDKFEQISAAPLSHLPAMNPIVEQAFKRIETIRSIEEASQNLWA